MRHLVESLKRVGPSDAGVLILGESGTGKELVARALHAASPRADKPFLSINCGALPPNIIESELFGHEKGEVKPVGNRTLVTTTMTSEAARVQLGVPAANRGSAHGLPSPRALPGRCLSAWSAGVWLRPRAAV
jgi:hypothetical protein